MTVRIVVTKLEPPILSTTLLSLSMKMLSLAAWCSFFFFKYVQKKSRELDAQDERERERDCFMQKLYTAATSSHEVRWTTLSAYEHSILSFFFLPEFIFNIFWNRISRIFTFTLKKKKKKTWYCQNPVSQNPVCQQLARVHSENGECV